MPRLENNKFLAEVDKLLQSTNTNNSSLYFTQKRYIPFDTVEGLQRPEDGKYSILIRCTDGNSDKSKKVKVSTVVNYTNLESFWGEYTNVLKNNISGGLLKKKKKKKSKAAGVLK